MDLLRRVGFVDVEMVSKVDVFKGPEGQQWAQDFGTVGANIRARKP